MVSSSIILTPLKLMVADILTKPLPRFTLLAIVDMIGIYC